jgi:hypothetical protein
VRNSLTIGYEVSKLWIRGENIKKSITKGISETGGKKRSRV